MSKTEEIKLSFIQLCWHYSVVPFLLITPLLFSWDLLNYYVLRKYDGVREPSELMTISLFFIALSILFYFIQKRRLRFREFNIHYTKDAFDKALKKTAEELKWKIIEKRKGYVRAYRNWDGSASWGELITIKQDNSGYYISGIEPFRNIQIVTNNHQIFVITCLMCYNLEGLKDFFAGRGIETKINNGSIGFDI